MTEEIRGLSSMATRRLLAELGQIIQREQGVVLTFTSTGGVEVARQVREGVAADVVVLAAEAMASLEADGLLAPGTVRPMFVSDVVAAVPSGSPAPRLDTENDLCAALASATRIAYSTGPSGTAFLRLLERWGMAPHFGDRLIQAPPGVPVGSLVAEGAADLGFQQLSELAGVPGVSVVGPLPGDAAIRSTFSGAVLATSPRPSQSDHALALLIAAETEPVVRANGMASVQPGP